MGLSQKYHFDCVLDRIKSLYGDMNFKMSRNNIEVEIGSSLLTADFA